MSYVNSELHCREKNLELHANRYPSEMSIEQGMRQIGAVPVFDEATQTAAHLLEAPICIVGVMDGDRQKFKAAFGLYRMGLMNELAISRELPRNESFCTKVIENGQALTIADTTVDDTTAQKQLVQKYGIRAYLGVPLMTSTEQCIGTLAVMELNPRTFSEREIELLELVARWSVSEYERIHLGKPIKASHSWVDMATAAHTTDTKPASEQSNLSSVKADLLMQMAQELRTPLTSILGMASMLNREIYGPLTEKQREYVDVIHNSGQHLLAVLNEMTDLESIGHPHEALNLASVDVEMICKQALSTLESVAQRQRQTIRMTVGLTNHNRFWMLDKEKTRQILYHLVLSLVQTASSESEIRVHLSERHQQLSIHIWVFHPWLGEGLPYSEMLLRQLLETQTVSRKPDSLNATCVEANLKANLEAKKSSLSQSLRRSLEVSETSGNLLTECPDKSINQASRQNLEVLLSQQLIEEHNGCLSIQGSPENGYKYVLTFPQLST